MRLLQVSHLFKYNKEAVVLNNVHFDYDKFRRLAIAGETGSGKTTLLKTIAGLIQPDAGQVLFEEKRVLGPDEKLLPGHSRIAYLSQHFELRNNYRVYDYLEMASKVNETEAHHIYELCQIEHLLKRKTDQLSGGERQRTALARLLTTSPRLLLLDEPYSNLDGLHKQALKTVINDIVEQGTACIMVSHDPLDVLPWAEEVLVMREGNLVQKGAPRQVYNQPMSEYVGGLFGDYNVLSPGEASNILGLNEIEDKQVFIRPENIQLQRDELVAGRVETVLFFGSYYEVEVVFGDTKLIVKTNHHSFAPGDRVTATALPENLWYL